MPPLCVSIYKDTSWHPKKLISRTFYNAIKMANVHNMNSTN